MLNKGDEQTQEVGDGSTAIQVSGNLVINGGLSYSEVRDIAMDVFRSNFLELAGESKEVTRKRAEVVTDKFLEKLRGENPSGLNETASPDFQYGLFSVQRDYARTADEDLGDLLVDLLVDRTKHSERDMAQIVLNECLLVAPKLTGAQIAALSVIFFVKYCSTVGIIDLPKLTAHFERFLKPFVELLPTSASSYQHLEFAGCGTIQVTSSNLLEILSSQYEGVFDKGVDATELSGASFYFNQNQQLTGSCPLDSGKIRVRAQNKVHLDQLLAAGRVSQSDSQRLRSAFGRNRLNSDEAWAMSVEAMPFLRRLLELWGATALHNMTLTSVGIGLAHANIKRLTGEFGDLSIWIN